MALAVAFGFLFIASAGASISADHSELAVLAGDVDMTSNLTAAALTGMGWDRGVIVRYNMVLPDSHDTAMTFIKGDHCLAAFSATNDIKDREAIIGGLAVTMVPPVDLCGFKIHAAVAQEMSSFLMSSGYADFVAFLNDGKCNSVTAMGTSFGGALATLWATCANVRANISEITFGARSDYALVTFAPFAMATTPVYNGNPGVPFVGMRYGLTEPDGGASARTGFHVATKSFRIQLLDLYVNMINTTGSLVYDSNIAGILANLKMQLDGMTSEDEIESAWTADVYPILVNYAIFTFGEAPKSNSIGFEIRAKTMMFAGSGALSYEYDPISSLGGFFGFKHALQDFQPLANKLVAARNGLSMAKVPAASAADMPKADLFQFMFSSFASQHFVNHPVCCYSSLDNEVCAAQYEPANWWNCTNSLLAYIPAATLASTTASTTTGATGGTSASDAGSGTTIGGSTTEGTQNVGEFNHAHGFHFAPFSCVLLMLLSLAQ